MQYKIRRAEIADLFRIEQIYAGARAFMADHGNPHQWGSTYPEKAMLMDDIHKGLLFVMENSQKICGVFYFYIGNDSCYETIYDGSWRADTRYGTIHRIASDGAGGILACAVDFCLSQISHLRIDTHEDNYVMQRAIEKQGFSKRGIVYMEDNTTRIAYDLLK